MRERLACAGYYREARGMGGGLAPNIIVVHSAETPETQTAAENVADYFATGTTSSTHATTDSDSVAQSVPLTRVCYGTGEGGVNGFSWQIEQAGVASQDRSQWTDDYSRRTIENTARVIREMRELEPRIRPVFLNAGQLAAGERWGITSHGEVHAAWPEGDGRTDPGPAYPWDLLLELVIGQAPAGTAHPTEDSMFPRVVTYAGAAGWWYTWVDPAQGRRVRRVVSGAEVRWLTLEAAFIIPGLFTPTGTPWVWLPSDVEAIPYK